MPIDRSERLRVFVCYKRPDSDDSETRLGNEFRRRFDKECWIRPGVIEKWDDCEIVAGDPDWFGAIAQALDECDLGVVLLTKAALVPGFISNVEWPRLRQRAVSGECVMLGVQVTAIPTDVAESLDFGRGQWFPSGEVRGLPGVRAFEDVFEDTGRENRFLDACLQEVLKIYDLKRSGGLGSFVRGDRPADAPPEAYTDRQPDPPENEPIVFDLGLDAYRREDGDRYRDPRRVRELIDRALLEDGARAVMVRGPSGVGKSSMVMAGVLPRLGADADGACWPSVVVRPAGDPLMAMNDIARELCAELRRRRMLGGRAGRERHYERLFASDPAEAADALLELLEDSPEHHRVVLYLDQFEQLVAPALDRKGLRGAREGTEHAALLASFLEHFVDHTSKRTALVLSIRDDRDYLLSAEPWAGLRRRLNPNTFVVDPPLERELEQIIRSTLADGNFEIDPELCSELVRETVSRESRDSSALPLLSLTLWRLGEAWRAEQRRRPETERRLRLEIYEGRNLGGFRGVVAAHVGEVMERTGADPGALERLFPHLVRADSEGRIVRRQVDHDALEGALELQQLVEDLGESRLLYFRGEAGATSSRESPAWAGGTFELMHDVLLTAWPELAAWIEQHQPELAAVNELEPRARNWRRRRKPHSDLLQPMTIVEIERSLRRIGGDGWHQLLGADAREFVEESHRQAILAAIANDEPNVLAALALAEPRHLEADTSTPDHQELMPLYHALFPETVPRPGRGESEQDPSDLASLGPNPAFDYFDDARLARSRKANPRHLHAAHMAALGGHLALLKHLAERTALFGDYVCANGRTPLHFAAIGGHVEVVRWLLELLGEACPSKRQQLQLIDSSTAEQRGTALGAAAQYAGPEVVDLLLEAGADPDRPNRHGWTALGISVWRGQLRTLEILLRRGASTAVVASEGRTALHLASLTDEHLPILERLLEHARQRIAASTVDDTLGWLDARDAQGRTPLDLALVTGAHRSAERLLRSGASIESGEGEEPLRSALLYAAASGSLPAVDALLRQGARADFRTEKGTSVLHAAAVAGDDDPELIERLLATEHAPDPRWTDRAGDLPIEDAMSAGNERIALALLERTLLDADAERIERLVGRALLTACEDVTTSLGARGAPLPLWSRVRDPSPDEERAVVERLSPSEIRLELASSLGEESGTGLPAGTVAIGVDEAQRLLPRMLRVLPPDFALGAQALTRLQASPISFYPGARFIEGRLRFADDAEGAVRLVEREGTVRLLDGGSRVLRDLNGTMPIRLSTQQEYEDYLRFFCLNVHGDHGPFRVVDAARDLPWASTLDETTLAGWLAAVEDAVRAPEPVDSRSDAMIFRCSLCYGPRLVETLIEVQDKGECRMLRDETLADKVPVQCERLEHGVFRQRDVPEWLQAHGDAAQITIRRVRLGAADILEKQEQPTAPANPGNADDTATAAAPAAPGQVASEANLGEGSFLAAFDAAAALASRGAETPTHAELAARLMRDAAGFFQTVGESNESLTNQMSDNDAVFRRVADMVEADPDEIFGDDDAERIPMRTIAAKLLRDAANFFRAVGDHNPPLAEQMAENASVFEEVAHWVESDPHGRPDS